MSSLRVDDEDSNVFTNGIWLVSHGDAMAYQGGVSVSHMEGATKVVRFRGTSISVIGFVLLSNDTEPPNQQRVVQFSIDDGSRISAPNPSADDYANRAYVEYFHSRQLSMGEHVLSMYVLAVDGALVLDEFVIQANGGAAQVLRSDGSPIPSKGGPAPSSVTDPSNTPAVGSSTQPSSSSTTSNQSSTSSNSPRSTSGSNSQPGASSDSTGNNPPSTTASSVFSASMYSPTTINANDRTAQDSTQSSFKSPLIAAIVVPSVLLVLAIVGITVFVIRRRRKTIAIVPVDPYPPTSPGEPMTQVLPPDKVSAGSPEPTPVSALSPASGPATTPVVVGRYDKQRRTTLESAGLPPYVE